MEKMIANRYLIVKNVGHGGMADVYVAMDTVLKREVAIKILKGELSNDPVALIRFEREASASTTLSHPNIVDIYDVGEDDGRHFIVMEYVRGSTLKQLINRRGALLLDESIYFMKQLVSATALAHRKGVIHRDIKPQNILVKDDGTLKMADFGISLAANALQLTREDAVLGSVHYLAPEIAKGEGATFQSDIYALGIVFYELLAGSVPFKGEEAVAIALKHVRENVPNIQDINPTIPNSVVNIISKATCKNKSMRYQTANEMYEDLESCLDEDIINQEIINLDEVANNEPTMVIDTPMSKKEAKKEVPLKSNKKIMKGFFFSFIGLLMVSLTALVILILLFLSGFISFPGQANVLMPDIVGMTVSEAEQELKNNGLVLNVNNISRVLTADTESGLIIASDPINGEEVKKGTNVDLVVSSGIYNVMKDYVGKDLEESKAELKQYPKIRVVENAISSMDYIPGTIINQDLMEAGMKFDDKQSYTVQFTYVEYSEMVIPYSIKGMAVEDAKKILESSGMKVLLSILDTSSLSQEEKDKLSLNTVVKTNPSWGVSYTQKEGNYITIFYYQ